jgi:hypothetical protein
VTRKMFKGFTNAAALLMLVGAAWLTPTQAQTFTGVFTQHNDTARTGQNLDETKLALANVNTTQFGKVFSYSVDGQIYAQPLYVPNVNIPGVGLRNVIYVATQNDSVFAFDADGLQSAPYWEVSFINPAEGITPHLCPAAQDKFCSEYPTSGINGTPVINPANRIMYLVTRTTNKGKSYQYLHALNIATGEEKLGGPKNITASVPGTGYGSVNGAITFPVNISIQRAGLLLANGMVYIGWAGVYHGWIMAYNANNLKQEIVWNTTPNARGGGIWFSGNGIAADASGDVYVAVADGIFDANTGGVDYGDTVIQFDENLNVLDYFTPLDQYCRGQNDMDLGSGGPMLLPAQPGSVPNEILISGKGGPPCDLDPAASPIYLLNENALGYYNSTQDQDVQEVTGAPGGYWSSPTYWQGANGTYVYFAGTVAEAGKGDYLKLYTMTNGLLSTTPTSHSSNIYPVGATPSISANGTTNGILWAVERQDALGQEPGVSPMILNAYDARDASKMLYNSASAMSQGVLRDRGGCGVKFAVPTIANGRVYVGTENELDVFGLLGSTSGPGVYLGNPCWAFKASNIGTQVTEPISLVNNGNAALNISNIAITGTNAADFGQTNTCGSSLAAGAKCVITVSFTASIQGAESAFVMITDNAAGSPHNIYVLGVGQN